MVGWGFYKCLWRSWWRVVFEIGLGSLGWWLDCGWRYVGGNCLLGIVLFFDCYLG